jgi:predicted GH43/DUF377 family glycosyl hydrolase
MKLSVNRSNTIIYPDNEKVIARFFFTDELRARKIISLILSLPEDEVQILVNQILREFSKRHRKITYLFLKHFEKVSHFVRQLNNNEPLNEYRKLLIGSYFTMEYAIESAALFNPSIVEDTDQHGLEPGQKRIVISLRATGEGHISSLVFRRAVIDSNSDIIICEPGSFIDEAEVVKNHLYQKNSFIHKLKEMQVAGELYKLVLDQLPERFTYDQIRDATKKALESNGGLPLSHKIAIEEILWLADSHTEIKFSLDTDISERVIFPISKFEKNGIEDARFVKFAKENGEYTYYATYTAYDGFTILPKLIETTDFYNFKIFPLHGKFAINKNLALFPRKVNGKYAMISRIDGVNNYVMFSNRLNKWDSAEILEEPLYPWELVQIGNGGSPIETEKGWLLITHGVGPVRKYCLGACLLDLDNPKKVIGKLKEPLLIPNEKEREGYVPNVVYTCGSLVHNGTLIIPYAMSDYATTFASVDLNALLEKIL